MLFQDAMAMALVDHGVDTIFGLIGDGNLFVMDSFRRMQETTYVGVVHEAAAVEAASGYAQVTGRVGVATVTHGPALTNTVTALVDAVRGGVPLVVIAGATKADDPEHLQSLPQREVVVAAGAGFEQMRAPRTAAADLAIAVRRARVEKRPVVLNMPVDFQWAETEYVPSGARLVGGGGARPSQGELDQALGLIATANRPVVLAGRGAITPDARAAVLRFAERIGAPVATTLKAKGLFAGSPHDLGVVGTIAHDVAVSTVAAADVVIVFGASLNRYTTADGSLGEKRRVVHVDNDIRSLGRFIVPDAAVLGDAEQSASEFVALLNEADIPSTSFASDGLAADLSRLATPGAEADGGADGYVDILSALRRVQSAVPADRTVVTDSGRFISPTWRTLHVEDPHHFIHTANFGSIGLGMGTAVGACISRPGHPTLLVTGDGGFMLGGLNEFTTAVRYGLDLIVVVLNDGSYGAEHIQFLRRELDPAMSLFDWPDFGPVADALGGRGFTVRSIPELDAALSHLESRDRPVLIDIHLDPNKAGGH